MDTRPPTPETPRDVIPECQACAACCFGQGRRYVPVTGDDYSRLGAEAAGLAQFVGNQCFMRMTDRHCAALEWQEGAGRFACSIHPLRPQVCRDLERSSPACLAEHEAKIATAAMMRGDPSAG